MLNAYTSILVFLFGQRTYIATTPFTYGIGHEKGDILNDKSAIRRAKHLGKSIVQLIDATAHLRKKE